MSLLIDAGGIRSSAFFSNRTAPVRLSMMIAALAAVSNACADETGQPTTPAEPGSAAVASLTSLDWSSPGAQQLAERRPVGAGSGNHEGIV